MEKEERDHAREDRKKAKESEVMLWLDKVPSQVFRSPPRRKRLSQGFGVEGSGFRVQGSGFRVGRAPHVS